MDPETSVPVSSLSPSPAPQRQLSFSLDYRVIILILLLVIIGMLAFWRPWSKPTNSGRTISVTGESTIKAEPDEFVFEPSYSFENADKAAGNTAATAKQTEIVAALKKLGVADKQIKASIDSYQSGGVVYYGIAKPTTDGQYTYTLRLTITLPDRTSAQKVQDYIATTDPEGTVTPYASFSDSLRTKLESQARDVATKDARSKADQSAKNLGFKVGSVKSVDDGTGFDNGGGIIPLNGGASLDLKAPASSTSSSPAVQPGQNDLAYSVTVVYYIR